MITYRDDLRPEPAVLYLAVSLVRLNEALARTARIYAGSNVVLTAWDRELFAGILRALSDGAYGGYIADLAIHPDYQRAEIGRTLLQRALASNADVQFALRAAPTAADHYRHIGWQEVPNGWVWPRER